MTTDNIDPTVAAIAAAGQLAEWIKGLLNAGTVVASLGSVFTPFGGGGFNSMLGGPGQLAGMFQQNLTPTSSPEQVCGALRKLAQ